MMWFKSKDTVMLADRMLQWIIITHVLKRQMHLTFIRHAFKFMDSSRSPRFTDLSCCYKCFSFTIQSQTLLVARSFRFYIYSISFTFSMYSFLIMCSRNFQCVFRFSSVGFHGISIFL